MSKERLEEITLEEIKRFYEGTATVYINWLIEQAERVEKLLEQTGHNFEVNRKLDAQNKRYREAMQRAIEYSNSGRIITEPSYVSKILLEALEESV